MDILELLKQDHDAQTDSLHALLRRIDGDGVGDRREIAAQLDGLAAELRVHFRTEEEVLYEACRRHGHPRLGEFAVDGQREHALIESMLASAVAAPDGELRAACVIVRDLYEVHIRDEEESNLFPLLRRVFTPRQRAAMGEAAAALKQRMSGGQDGHGDGDGDGGHGSHAGA